MNNIEPGCLVSYKPQLEGTDPDDLHRVKVLTANLSDVSCEDVFGNNFRLSYGSIVKVETGSVAIEFFNSLQETFA